MSRRCVRSTFGSLADGRTIEALTLSNGHLELKVITYGGILTALRVPDAANRPANVVLGFDRLDEYLTSSPYFGAIVGRYANRIAHAQFVIDGCVHRLTANERPHHLHGGFRGFDKQVWTAETTANGKAVVLQRRSADGEEGYPGNLDVQVTYTLMAQGEVCLDYEARTDAATHVNLTQHSYFNLHGASHVLDHLLTIQGGAYLPVDDRRIPVGGPSAVDGSPFDFRTTAPLGSRMRDYDHNFVIDGGVAGHARPVARIVDPASRRTLEVRSTEPGLQLYSGQVVGHRGFCLEPQHFPDSPNRPDFPPTLLRPGQVYRSRTELVFGVDPAHDERESGSLLSAP